MMSSIREAGSDDSDALSALWARCNLTRPWNDPGQDIGLALSWPASRIFVAEMDGEIVASAMPGFDGHRGWIYYVAVDPDHQGQGLGRRIMEVAEDWLTEQGAPKVEVIMRAENTDVRLVYGALGYKVEPRLLMAKWLRDPPEPPPAEPIIPNNAVTVTWLEMLSAPTKPPRSAPTLPGKPLSLQHIPKPSVPFYRYIQHTVGDPWLWWERRTFPDEKLAEIIHDDRVEFYVLSVSGEPAGFIELDFREMPASAEVAYFGLMPHFIGGGLGPYLLEWGIDCAWNRDPAPDRLLVNTCTHDHPAALGGYQRSGFTPYKQETKIEPDPFARGIIPKTVKVLSNTKPVDNAND